MSSVLILNRCSGVFIIDSEQVNDSWALVNFIWSCILQNVSRFWQRPHESGLLISSKVEFNEQTCRWRGLVSPLAFFLSNLPLVSTDQNVVLHIFISQSGKTHWSSVLRVYCFLPDFHFFFQFNHYQRLLWWNSLNSFFLFFFLFLTRLT